MAIKDEGAGTPEEDPWGFLPARQPATEATSKVAQPAEVRERGEIRAAVEGSSLKQRSWPMAVALAGIFFAGFVTEVVAASQMIALAGTKSLLFIYPLGGLGLLLLGLVQFRLVDGAARLKVLRYATLVYAILFTIALVFIAGGLAPILAVGLIWLLADQLNYLLPLLIWSLAGDEFNVAEGRKVFGWLVTWTYVGQISGLAVALVTPIVLRGMNFDLSWLLIIAPIVCVMLALWLPHALRNSSAAKGTAHRESLNESIKGAAEFINGVPVWRSLMVASTLTFVAGTTVIMGYSVGVGDLLGRNAADLQIVFAATWIVALGICWAIQHFFAEGIAERAGIAKTLIILPIATALAAIALALGSAIGSIALLIVAIIIWRIPRWSLDENARRGALALVPDERRTRVSFLIDLTPVAVGLVVSAPIVGIGFLTGMLWLPGIVALVIALVAVFYSRKVMKGWDESLMNWRLRRRKQNRAINFGSDE